MDSEDDATSCSVCTDIYSDPRSLPCGHSFCLKCLQGVAGNDQKFLCPICRFNVDLRDVTVDQLPKNFVLLNVIEARDKTHSSMCLDHKKSFDLFCEECDVVICSKCFSMQHKGHDIEEIDTIFNERNKHLSEFLDSTKHWASMTQEKRDAVEQSRISMEKNIDSVSTTVENSFKQWHDALQKQHNAILSYVHQERDQKRHVFYEAERVLGDSMKMVAGLETEINKLRIKGMTFVVKEYGSLKARQEYTERKILQEIKTCFTPPDNSEIEVYAPWIAEAIHNIKPIDSKLTQAKPNLQKIAEIQRQNVILKRKCEKLQNTIGKLKKRKTEVEQLKHWNKYLESLIQNLHDHVVAGVESSPREIKQPAGITPGPSIVKTFHDIQDIHKVFMQRESDIKELKDKNLGQGILMAALDEYVTSKKQNVSFDIPSAIQLDPRFVLERGQTKRIAQGFEQKERDLAASEQDMAIKTKEYIQNFETLRTKYKNMETAYRNLQGTFKKANAYKSKLEDNTKLQDRISYLKEEKTDMDAQYKMKIYNQNQKIAMLKQEKESLLTKLSKMAGDRLTHDKVNIADLSDAVSPTKLSEIYSELYDNEWTDAFEEMTEESSLSDEAAITFLHEILMNAFRKCKEITWHRYESLKLIASTLDFKHENVTSTITTESKAETSQENDRSSLTVSAGVSSKDMCDSYTQTDEASCEGTSQENDRSSLTVSAGVSTIDMCDRDTQTDETSYEGTSEENDRRSLTVSAGLYNKGMCDSDTQTDEASYEGTSGENDRRSLATSAGVCIRDKCDSDTQTEEASYEKDCSSPAMKDKNEKDTQTEEILYERTLDGKYCSSNLISERLSMKDKIDADNQTDENIYLLYAELSTCLSKYETEMPKTYKYITVCTDLCWKMGVQEKPMHLDIIAEKQVGQEKLFDTDKFRAYTKTGKSVAYVVWPALFLHEGGAMLAKGIAQGCQKGLIA